MGCVLEIKEFNVTMMLEHLLKDFSIQSVATLLRIVLVTLVDRPTLNQFLPVPIQVMSGTLFTHALEMEEFRVITTGQDRASQTECMRMYADTQNKTVQAVHVGMNIVINTMLAQMTMSFISQMDLVR